MLQESDYRPGQGASLGVITSFAVIFCMVISILGIKLKWFKRRLDFQQLSNTSSNGLQSRYRQNRSDEILSFGVFRIRHEDDFLTETNKSNTLPPIRVPNSTDFRIPLPHEENTSETRTTISQPIRPIEQPPNYIPRTISESVIVQVDENLGMQDNPGTNIVKQQNTFQKRDVPFKKHTHNLSNNNRKPSDQNQEDIMRRPTGIVPPSNKVILDHTLDQNHHAEEEIYKNDENISEVGAEDDFLNVLKMPTPEPRGQIPIPQTRKIINIKNNENDYTEI